MSNVERVQAIYEALEIHLRTFGDDGKVNRFLHCIDRHSAVLAYGL